MWIFNRKKREAVRKERERMAKVNAMFTEYWKLHAEIYVRILRCRTRHTIDGAWAWANAYADEYMERKYGGLWKDNCQN